MSLGSIGSMAWRPEGLVLPGWLPDTLVQLDSSSSTYGSSGMGPVLWAFSHSVTVAMSEVRIRNTLWFVSEMSFFEVEIQDPPQGPGAHSLTKHLSFSPLKFLKIHIKTKLPPLSVPSVTPLLIKTR